MMRDTKREKTQQATRVFVAVALASQVCFPGTAVAASGDLSSSESAPSVQASQGADPVDITAAWSAGSITLSQAGAYTLSGDVTTSGTLFIAAPAGQTITLDVAGHSVSGQDAATLIDVTASSGTVVITDSTYDARTAQAKEAGADETDAAAPAATLSLTVDNPTSDVRVIDARGTGLTDDAQPTLAVSDVALSTQVKVDGVASAVHGAYGIDLARKDADHAAPTTTLDNVSIALGRTLEGTAKDSAAATAARAVGVHAASSALSLDGYWSDTATGYDSATGIDASAVDANGADAVPVALSIESDFSPKQATSVRFGSASAGDVVAREADGTVLPAESTGWFTSADTAKTISASSDGTALVLANAQVVATGTGSAASSSSATAGSSTASSGAAAASGATPGGSAAADASSTEEAQAPTISETTAASVVSMTPLDRMNTLLGVETGTDLNAAWAKQTGGMTEPFVISQSGTYYLSADLAATSCITIDGDGIDVTIELRGHTLSFANPEQGSTVTSTGYGIDISNAKSVTIDGSTNADAGSTSTIALTTTPLNAAVLLEAGSLSVSDTTIAVKPRSTQLSSNGSYGIRANAGSVAANNVTIDVDLSNQARAAEENTHITDVPAGVYLGQSVEQATLVDVDATVSGSPVIAPATDDDVSSTQSSTTSDSARGNAYGLYSLSKGAVAVKGGSYSATQAIGSAAGIYAVAATVTNDDAGAGTTVAASASRIEAGVLSGAESGVVLAGSLTFNPDTAQTSAVAATLRALQENSFTLADGFAPNQLSALVGTAAGVYNDTGVTIASFSDTATDADRSNWAGLAANALGTSAPCTVTAGASGLVFSLDESAAQAVVEHADGTTTAYSSVSSALAAAVPGETVKLQADVGAVSFTKSGEADDRYTLDLNGHSIASLYDASGASLSVTSTATDDSGAVVPGSIVGTYSDGTNAAAVHFAKTSTSAAAPTLSLSQVDVTVEQGSSPSYGVYDANTGTLAVNDVAISVAGGLSKAIGIGLTAAGTLDVKDSTVDVAAYAQGVQAYGVQSTIASASVTITDTKMQVSGIDAKAAGVDTAGDATLAGSASSDAASISVSTTGAATAAFGVRVGRANHTVTIDNYRVSVSVEQNAQTGDFWALSGGEAASPLATTFVLRGAVGLTTPANATIRSGGTPVRVASDFSSADGTVYLGESQTTDDVAVAGATASDGSAETLPASLATTFAAAPGSYYDGWKLSTASDGSSLTWSHDAVAQLSSTGETYSTLAAALAAASDGDTLTLVDDVAAAGPISISKALTIDVAGHTLSIANSSAASKRAQSAIDFTGAGSLTIADSVAGTGSVALSIGSSSEPAKSGANPYAGISVTGGGSLVIDSVPVAVSYVGATSQTTTLPQVTADGIRATSGSVALRNGASVSLDASAGSTGFGAITAQGIALSGAATADVPAGTSVTVTDAAKRISDGKTIDQERSTEDEAADSVRSSWLVQIFPEEGSDLYNQIQEKFRTAAKYDSGVDAKGSRSGYSDDIYYAAPLRLDDGTLIYAFSEPVDQSQAGTDAVKAAVFFEASYYDVVPQATGVAQASGATGTVTVAGSVAATCENGNANAIDLEGTGSATVDGAALSASASTTTYRKVTGAFDLRNYVTFSTDPGEVITYPDRNANMKVVAQSAPTARGVKAADGASVTLAGAVSIDASGIDASEIEASSFAVGAGFSAATPQGATFSVANPAGSNTEGATFATAAGSTPSAAMFADHYGACAVESASDGSLAWKKAADDGAYTVSFNVEGATVSTQSGLAAGSTATVPDASVAALADTYRETHTLLGWSTTRGAVSIDTTRGDIAADATSVSVTGDATYYAVYETSLFSNIVVTFANVRNADGTTQAQTYQTVRYGQTALQAGLTVPTPADYTVNGTTYRFVGWSISTLASTIYDPKSFASSLVFDSNCSGVMTGSVTLVASYVPVPAGSHLVTFKAGDLRESSDGSLTTTGIVKAYAVRDGESPSYSEATAGNNAVPSISSSNSSGYNYAFKGWYAGWLDSIEYAEGDTLYTGSLPAATEDATYTARFERVPGEQAVLLYYWHDLGAGMNYSAISMRATTGEDITERANALVKVGDSFSSDGKTYTFLGWSKRSSDTAPMYTDALPAVTGGSSLSQGSAYFGIYQEKEQTVNVVFHVNGQEYATASDVAASQTLTGAQVASTNPGNPSDSADGKAFLGWATTEGATKALSGSATVGSLVADGSDTLDLYAVYGDQPSYTVSFYSASGTRLGAVSVQRGSTLSQAVVAGSTLPTAPSVAGKVFAGWTDALGNVYDPDKTQVTGTTRLTATYADITTSAASDGAQIDASNMAVTAQSAATAKGATAQIATDGSMDTYVYAKMAEDGFSTLQGYEVEVRAGQNDANGALLTSDIGVMTVKLPVSSGFANSRIRVYWIKGDGTVGASADKTVDEDGFVSVNVDSYNVSDEGANFVLAYVPGSGSGGELSDSDAGSSDGAGGSGDAGSSGSGLASSDGSGLASASGGTLAAASTGSLATATGGSSLATADGSDGLAESTDGSDLATADGDTDADGANGLATTVSAPGAQAQDAATDAADDAAAQQQAEGNLNALWFVIGVVAVLAVGARALWGLLMRRRRKDDDGEEPYGSDPTTGESIRF